MGQRMDVQVGMDVKSRDGRKLGKVIGLADDAFVVERGLFFVRDYRVPFRAVETIERGDIYLSLNREQLSHASLSEVLDVTDRLLPTPDALSEVRMGTPISQDEAAPLEDDVREESASHPIGFMADLSSRH
ncbi:hypothetical protein [Melittangium boletus]|uniref:DUF2171 domain-containing protein n=1 Tax=Melittangium boletus DSM 14713 TaxID=1294270 RepID=A0A250III9_9BACT|nr:hypothetical protein [Melittangium boletus]ATB31088.1 hypothetical protein MEBOL_004550 [Melittangium boletus DSM 14713]